MEFSAGIELFNDKLELYYSIKKIDLKAELETTIITAICSGGRTINLDIISKENMPENTKYEIVFLLYSEFFNGKSDNSRQKIDVDKQTFNIIKKVFIAKINNIFNKKIPSIKEKNQKIKEDLINKYPHYYGYFDETSIGLINRDKTLEIAQNRFFQVQKKY